MIRITCVSAEESIVLEVEGELTGAPELEALKKEFARASIQGRTEIDLSAVTSTSRVAIEHLHSLRAKGVRLKNCLPYLSEALLNTWESKSPIP